MPRAERKQIIEQIEKLRDSRVLVYVTGDRPPIQVCGAQIGDDSVRPIYDHLRELGHVERLDLFIYSRGGDIDIPWRLANALRAAADEWRMLVPYRANSAATLLGMAADSIVFGRHAELGPIDPMMSIQRQKDDGTLTQDNIFVEDIMSYQRFIKERAGLSDQDGLSSALGELTKRLDAVSLGSAYRTHSHIREVARRIMLSRKDPPSQQAMATIIETLAERVYAHGHAIGLGDALEVGLPAVEAESGLDDAMWSLHREFEKDMKLLEPLDPMAVVANTDLYTEDVLLAVVETAQASDECRGEVEVRAKRQMPANLTVNLNLNLALPGNINLQQLPANVQQALQALQQAVLQQAQQAVQQAMKDQAPLVGAEASLRNRLWRRI